MLLLIVIVLVIAAVTGTLWQVLEIAAGVAIGIFVAGLVLAVAGYLFVRSRFRAFRRDWTRDRGDPRYRDDRPERY